MNQAENFDRYAADGLRSDLALKGEILAKIRDRGGQAQPIETRMLASIERFVELAELTEDRVRAIPQMPNVFELLTALGQERIVYVSFQKMGSHHVHGTWSSLLSLYLSEAEDGRLRPNGDDAATTAYQYSYVIYLSLTALTAFLNFVLEDRDEFARLFDFLGAVQAEVETAVALMGDG